MYRYIGIERERVYFEIIDATQKRYAINIKHKYHTKHTIRAKKAQKILLNPIQLKGEQNERNTVKIRLQPKPEAFKNFYGGRK